MLRMARRNLKSPSIPDIFLSTQLLSSSESLVLAPWVTHLHGATRSYVFMCTGIGMHSSSSSVGTLQIMARVCAFCHLVF